MVFLFRCWCVGNKYIGRITPSFPSPRDYATSQNMEQSKTAKTMIVLVILVCASGHMAFATESQLYHSNKICCSEVGKKLYIFLFYIHACPIGRLGLDERDEPDISASFNSILSRRGMLMWFCNFF